MSHLPPLTVSVNLSLHTSVHITFEGKLVVTSIRNGEVEDVDLGYANRALPALISALGILEKTQDKT